MIDIRKPYITQSSLAGQVAEIRSYLFGLVDQLNYYLNNSSQGGTIVIESSDEVGNAKALYAAVKSLIEEDFTDDKTFSDFALKTNEALDALKAADKIVELKTETVGGINYRIRRWESGYTEIEGLKPSGALTASMDIVLPKGLSSVSTWHIEAESTSAELFIAYRSVSADTLKITVKEWNDNSLGNAALRISLTGFWKEETANG